MCTFLSRVLGLVRDMVIVAALGLGADIFFMAFRIPNIMRRMAAEGVLGMAHTARLGNMQGESPNSPKAEYTAEYEMRHKVGQEAKQNTEQQIRQKTGQEVGHNLGQKNEPQQSVRENGRGVRYSLRVALGYGGVTALVAALLWPLAPFCMRLVAPGFDEARLQETVSLFRWCLAYLPLASVTAILAATLIAYGRAGYAALAPVLLNLGILLVGVGAFMTGEAVYFAAGVVVGGIVQLAWLLLWLYRIWPINQQVQDSRSQSDGDESTHGEATTHDGLPEKEKVMRGAARAEAATAIVGAGEAQEPEAKGAQGAKESQEAKKARHGDVETVRIIANGPGSNGKEYLTDGELQKASWIKANGLGNGKKERSDGTQCFTSLRGRLRSAARVFLTVAIGSSAYLYFFMSSVGASLFFPGAVSAMYIGERFIEFPLAIIGSSISMAFMPQFSRLVHNQEALRTALEKTLRLSCLIAFPAALGIILFHKTIVSLFFGHGAMGSEEVLVTAQMLSIMGCSLPAFCLSRQIMGALIAMAEASSFGTGQGCGDRLLRAMGRSVWGGCGVVLVFALLFGNWLGLGAVAWGVAIAAWGQCLHLWHLACRKMVVISPLEFLGQHIPLIGALILLAVGLWGVNSVLEHIESAWLAGGLLCIVVVGVACGWLKGLALWGNDEANMVWEAWRKIGR